MQTKASLLLLVSELEGDMRELERALPGLHAAHGRFCAELRAIAAAL